MAKLLCPLEHMSDWCKGMVPVILREQSIECKPKGLAQAELYSVIEVMQKLESLNYSTA